MGKLRIDVEVIPHNKQRYETCGDWWWEAHMATRKIRVSMLKNVDMEFCVAIHEMIEQHLCIKRVIRERIVTLFDMRFEEERAKGLHKPDAEPGDDPNAPYHKEHVFATNIERQLASEFGIDWESYERRIATL